MKTEYEIKNALTDFRGTSTYHKHLFPGKSPILLTDGCEYVREFCRAYWLFDAILSYQEDPLIRNVGFQIWTLEEQAKNSTWLLSCKKDKGLPSIIKQVIEYSDFPLDKITIWKIGEVCLLPSEY